MKKSKADPTLELGQQKNTVPSLDDSKPHEPRKL